MLPRRRLAGPDALSLGSPWLRLPRPSFQYTRSSASIGERPTCHVALPRGLARCSWGPISPPLLRPGSTPSLTLLLIYTAVCRVQGEPYSTCRAAGGLASRA